MSHHNLSSFLLGLTLVGGFGCRSGSGPGTMQPVRFQLAASTAGAALTAEPLQITSLRLVVGPAALGNGTQFGCVDCQGNDTESATAPQLISVPTDGGQVSVATEQVTPGRYGAAEIELVHPDAAVLNGNPSWPPDATIEVSGTLNGATFVLQPALQGTFRQAVEPPVDVTEAGLQAISVTITLPVREWFSSNGAILDPNDPVQRAQIEQNIRSSLQPPEHEKESQD